MTINKAFCMVVDGGFGRSYTVRKGKSFPEHISTAGGHSAVLSVMEVG